MTITDEGATGAAAKPPYISFKTLMNLVGRLKDDGFPARIDKSFLESTAGGYATVVIASLRWLDLLHNDGRPTDSLKHLVTSEEEERKQHLATVLRLKYPGLEGMAAANETQAQLLEYFTSTWGLAGDTRRKAIAFYLAAAKWSGVPVGSLWKTPPSGGGGKRNAGNGRKPPPPAGEEVLHETPDAGLPEGLSTALRGVLERLPRFGEKWTQREREMFKRSFDNVLEWDYPVSDPSEAGRAEG